MNQTRLTNSLADAWHGLFAVFYQEQNFRIQLFFGILVLLTASVLGIPISSILILVCVIVSILALEIINSAIEHMLDLLKPRLHDQVKLIKDMMAGAVFLCSLCATIVGVMIFLPYIVEAFRVFVINY